MRPRVAILTGRSDPGRTGLSYDQRAFLQAVLPPGFAADPQGYPFRDGALPERNVALPLASYRNAKVWLGARLSRRFQGQARAAMGRLGERGVQAVITGSCGLDILRAAGESLPFRVIALGPVGPAAQEVTTIIGRRDWIARGLHRRAPDHWVPGGHMDYWACPETQALVRHALAGLRP